jgi:hypothetical protein
MGRMRGLCQLFLVPLLSACQHPPKCLGLVLLGGLIRLGHLGLADGLPAPPGNLLAPALGLLLRALVSSVLRLCHGAASFFSLLVVVYPLEYYHRIDRCHGATPFFGFQQKQCPGTYKVPGPPRGVW